MLICPINEVAMNSLGINVGSSSLKMVSLEGDSIAWSVVLPHEGDFLSAVRKALAGRAVPAGTPSLVTGNEGRGLFALNNTIEPLCIEAALRAIGEKVDAVVTMGGEDLIVYTVDERCSIVNNFSGNKCASGTGEFFKQQLARMDMGLEDAAKVGKRREGDAPVDALLRLHEVRLHPPPQQARSHQGRYRRLALDGDGDQGGRLPASARRS